MVVLVLTLLEKFSLVKVINQHTKGWSEIFIVA